MVSIGGVLGSIKVKVTPPAAARSGDPVQEPRQDVAAEGRSASISPAPPTQSASIAPRAPAEVASITPRMPASERVASIAPVQPARPDAASLVIAAAEEANMTSLIAQAERIGKEVFRAELVSLFRDARAPQLSGERDGLLAPITRDWESASGGRLNRAA